MVLGVDYSRRTPVTLSSYMFSNNKLKRINKRGITIIAPFWSDNDATYGNVSHQIYNKFENKLSKTDIQRCNVSSYINIYNNISFTIGPRNVILLSFLFLDHRSIYIYYIN